MKKLTTFAMSLVLALGVVACDDDDDPTGPDGDDGTFTVTITGDFEAEFDGMAFFGEVEDPVTAEEAWVLWLTTSDDQAAGRAVYFVRAGDRPDEGTYALFDIGGGADPEDDEIWGAFFDYSSQTLTTGFVSTSGSLTITESESDEVEGTFTIQATGFILENDEPTEAEMTITGEFDAESDDVLYPLLGF